MRSPESVGVCGASRYVDSRLAMPPCWYMHTRAHLERAALNHFQPLPFLSVSVVSPTLDVTPPSPCTCFFLPFSTRFIYPSSFYSRTAGSRTRACTHAELNPLCDDERTPLESFDIGDVGKYIEGRIYRIFFPTQSARCSGPDGEFQPR